LLEELNQLITLQDLDLEIRTLYQAQEELPGNLQELQVNILGVQTALEEEKLQLEELRKQHRHLESEMAMLDEGISRSRQRLMEIKDNLEYKAMLREIAFKEDRKDQKETEILEMLEMIEERVDSIERRHQQVTLEQQEMEKRQADIQEKMTDLNQQLARLEEGRAKILQGVSPTLLKRYEFIRDRRHGIAITAVRQGVCQACHMNLPPQQFIELQKEESIMTCPHCQRIIYWLGNQTPEENSEANAA
jgi:hypothetical protein